MLSKTKFYGNKEVENKHFTQWKLTVPREKFIFTNNSAKYKDMYTSFLAIKKASQLLNIRKFKIKSVTTFKKYFLKLKKFHVKNNIEISFKYKS